MVPLHLVSTPGFGPLVEFILQLISNTHSLLLPQYILPMLITAPTSCFLPPVLVLPFPRLCPKLKPATYLRSTVRSVPRRSTNLWCAATARPSSADGAARPSRRRKIWEWD